MRVAENAIYNVNTDDTEIEVFGKKHEIEGTVREGKFYFGGREILLRGSIMQEDKVFIFPNNGQLEESKDEYLFGTASWFLDDWLWTTDKVEQVTFYPKRIEAELGENTLLEIESNGIFDTRFRVRYSSSNFWFEISGFTFSSNPDFRTPFKKEKLLRRRYTVSRLTKFLQ